MCPRVTGGAWREARYCSRDLIDTDVPQIGRAALVPLSGPTFGAEDGARQGIGVDILYRWTNGRGTDFDAFVAPPNVQSFDSGPLSQGLSSL